jgi:signal transduction histidine kinase
MWKKPGYNPIEYVAADHSKLHSTEYADLNRVLGWFITLRWIACIGVTGVLLLLHGFSSYPIPYPVLYGITAALFISNLFFSLYYLVLKKKNLSRGELGAIFHFQIILDYLFLYLLLFFTGFVENPLSIYFVFHILLTSFIFCRRIVFFYAGALTLLLVLTALGQYFSVLPLYTLLETTTEEAYRNMLFLRAFALCTTIMISAYLVTSIKDRLEERGRKVEIELDRYKNLDKIKSTFILQVTHELRGPLAALKGYHEMIMKGITGEIQTKTAAMLEKANRRTENLLTIIDEMIDYAYMKSEEDAHYTPSELRLEQVVDDNVEHLEPRASRKHIALLTSISGDTTLYVNRDLINIILTNLITNAITYSPPNTTIRINTDSENGCIHLSVIDEGIGIDEDELNTVFEEFYRGRRARELEKDGTGLGLSIVRRAVESLNGTLTVYSEVDKGTSFHIRIPKSSSYTNNGGLHGREENTDNR